MKAEHLEKRINTDVDQINCVKNSRFALGRQSATGWRWDATGSRATWHRTTGSNGDAGVMTIESSEKVERAQWVRRVPCKGNEYYRVEMVACCQCEGDSPDAGLVLMVSLPSQGGKASLPRKIVIPKCTKQMAIFRAYLHTPKDAKSVEIRVGLERASGWARIEQVLMLPILEPEALSHPLACPPPPYAYPAPRTVRTICVASDQQENARTARLVGRLVETFGSDCVRVSRKDTIRPGEFEADALLLIDALPPKSTLNLRALVRLAQQRIVVVSLPAFARMAGPAASMRTIVQGDDPIHAQVRLADYLTRGFAIDDIFPYAWRAADQRCFVQRQIRRTPEFREFCQTQGFEDVLHSVCETDGTSGHAICLLKRTAGGALIVLDLEPVAEEGTNFAEPDLAAFLLRNVLGEEQTTLGQYVVPASGEKVIRDEIAEMGRRFPEFVVRGDDHPNHPRHDQFGLVGAGQESYGLPMPPRPLILIRSGLSGLDFDGVYGALLWFKQLLRDGRFACPYASADGGLIARHQLAWIPLAGSWGDNVGWWPEIGPEPLELPDLSRIGPVGAIVDITCGSSAGWRVVVPEANERDVLLRSLAAVPIGPESREAARVSIETRSQIGTPRSRADGEDGAARYRIECPPASSYFPIESIIRTDVAASLLERVVGLRFGLLAVNRTSGVLQVDRPGAGQQVNMLTIQAGKPRFEPIRVQNQHIHLPPGNVLVIRPV